MMGIKNKLKYLVIGVFACFFFALGGVGNVSAATDAEAWDSSVIFRKGIIAAARKCYTVGALKKDVKFAEILEDGFRAIFNETGLDKKVPVPSGFGLLAKGDKGVLTNEIACGDLFLDVNVSEHAAIDAKSPWGQNVISSVLKIGATKINGVNIDQNKSTEEINRVMEALGYVREKAESDDGVFALQWNLKDQNGNAVPGGERRREFAFDFNNHTLEYTGPIDIGIDGEGAPVWFSVEEIQNSESENRMGYKVHFWTLKSGQSGDVELNFPVFMDDVGFRRAWSEFKTNLKNKIYNLGSNGVGDFLIESGEQEGYIYDFIDDSDDAAGNYIYKIEKEIDAIRIFEKQVSGNSNFSENTVSNGIRYDTNQKVSYFLRVLKNHFYNSYQGAIIECGEFDDFGVGNRIPINVDEGGVRRENCYILNNSGFVDDTNNHTSVIYGFKNSWFCGETGLGCGYVFKGVVEEINELTKNWEIGAGITDDDITPGDGGDVNVADACYQASGLNGMNWVLCPALYNLKGSVEGISGMLDNMLEVDTSLYGSNSDAHHVWEIMQTIANVVMTIVLLVVIFSQLTGYGIDNYGIKKILPKLIVMAILVNLSFLLCQIAIDLSNILGQGLNNLLQTAANNKLTYGEIFSGLTDALIALLVGAGAASPIIISGIAAASSGGNIAVIAVLALSILAILVGVIIFVLTLGARMIIIILFTVLSPIALACYILPNTQKWFKNWWKVFSTALVIYPICGAMYGVSMIIISIVFGNTMPTTPGSRTIDVAMALVAMLTPILPYYVIPALLKNVMNGLGAAGQFLNSVGNSVRRGISEGNRALQNTGAYKSGTETARRNMNRWTAGLDRNGDERQISRFGRFLRGSRQGMAAARQQYVNDLKKKELEDSLMGNIGFTAAKIGQEKAAEADNLKDAMTLLNYNTRNGEDMDELLKLISDGGEYANNKTMLVAAARIAGRRKDTAVKFMEHVKKDAGNYSPELLRGVAKEMATGDNSSIYRSSTPVGFAWASAINKMKDGESLPTNYDAWKAAAKEKDSEISNAENAIETFVTNNSELEAMKGSELRELIEMRGSGIIGDAQWGKLQALATERIKNSDKNPLDYSKAQELATISGEYEYIPGSKTEKAHFRPIHPTMDQQTVNNAAQPGQVFSTRSQQSGAGAPVNETPAQQDLRSAQERANATANAPGAMNTRSGIYIGNGNTVNTTPRERIVYEDTNSGNKTT